MRVTSAADATFALRVVVVDAVFVEASLPDRDALLAAIGRDFYLTKTRVVLIDESSDLRELAASVRNARGSRR